MELIRPTLGDDVHDAARVPAVACAVVVGLNTEFLQRIRKRERDVHVVVLIEEVCAVEGVARLIVARAVHVYVCRTGQLCLAGCRVGCDTAHAGNEVHGFDGVAAVERQFNHALTFNNVAERLRSRVHQWSALSVNNDRLDGRADLELDIDGGTLIREQRHAFLDELLEPRSLDHQRVLRRPQVRDYVLTARIGYDITRKTRVCLCRRDFRAGYDGPLWIGDDTADRAERLTVRGQSGDRQYENERESRRQSQQRMDVSP